MKKIVFLVFFIVSFAFSMEHSLRSEKGRFVFGQVNPSSTEQYLLDTQTGNMWHIVTEGKDLYLQRIYFIDENGNVSISLEPRPLEPPRPPRHRPPEPPRPPER